MKNLTSENCREFIAYISKIVYDWNSRLEIFSRPQQIEKSRQYYCFSEQTFTENSRWVPLIAAT